MIEKIISGGQIGADIAALRAAKKLGIETGGYMTYGWKTLEGPRPEYADEYGMTRVSQVDYPSRTKMNVKESDGTLRFATDWLSPGEVCTMKWIIALNKPFLDIDPSDGESFDTHLSFAKRWVHVSEIKTLNVAGNAHKNLEPYVEYFIEKLLERKRYADPGD